MASSWATETQEKVNYTKLSRLLYDGGSNALRSVFDAKCPPTSLKATLKTKKTILLNPTKPKRRVLNNDQCDKLYPPSGASPNSKDFDITLLFLLLRNICGLTKPAKGWDVLPPTADTSLEANLVRIKIYRNKVIAHSSKAEVDEICFEAYWKTISDALVSLGLKQDDIDQLKSSPLGAEDYNQLLKDWCQADEDIKSQLEAIKSSTDKIDKIQHTVEEIKTKVVNKDGHPISKLALCEFDGVVSSLSKSYHPKTREWIFDKVKSYIESEQSQSIAVVIKAGPGMGKSVVAAKICQMYKESKDVILGACHFFQHNHSIRNNPRLMLQSIARQLCSSVPGYQDALERNLSEAISARIPNLGCKELCTLFLEEPCCKLVSKSNVVVVIDALDECNNLKGELIEAFYSGGEMLSCLPTWLRFVITTRPPPGTSFLSSKTTIDIKPDDDQNKSDLQMFLTDNLKDPRQVSSDQQSEQIKQLVGMTKGIFLVASFVIDFLRNSNSGSLSEAVEHFSKGKGITSVYEDYFSRLRKAINPYIKSEEGFFKMLDAIVAAKFPVEKKIFYNILGLVEEPRVPNRERKEAINLLHQLFPVENDHVSAFHKTVIDWLTTGDHYFSAKVDGSTILANKCYELLSDMKQGLDSKNPDEPPIFTDSEMYALQFGADYMESPSFSKEKRIEIQTNCFVFCYLFMQHFLRYGGWRIYDNYRGQTKANVGRELKRHCEKVLDYMNFIGRHHRGYCQFYCPSLSHVLGIILQNIHLLDITSEIQLSPKPVDLLKQYGLPYHDRQIVMKLPEEHCFCHPYIDRDWYANSRYVNIIPSSTVEILPCDKAFFLVQYSKQTVAQIDKTSIQKYQLDGTLVSEETFSGHKKMYMSPDNRVIVAIPVLSKENIEIIDASTLKSNTSYKSPNVVRTCHVFGSQPWYIVARCFNNKIYVMEGETGKVIHQPVAIDQFDEVEAVSSQGHIVLGRTEKTSVYLPERDTMQNAFTDESGTFFEEMLFQGDLSSRQTKALNRKLFLCQINQESHELIKIPLYPRKQKLLCNCIQTSDFQYFQYQAIHFSEDGRLFAFVFKYSITVLNTSDGSLYCHVLHNVRYIDDILFLTKDFIFFYDWTKGLHYMNLETKEVEHAFSVTFSGSNCGVSQMHRVPGFGRSEPNVFLTVSPDLERSYQRQVRRQQTSDLAGQRREPLEDKEDYQLHIYKYSIHDLKLEK